MTNLFASLTPELGITSPDADTPDLVVIPATPAPDPWLATLDALRAAVERHSPATVAEQLAGMVSLADLNAFICGADISQAKARLVCRIVHSDKAIDENGVLTVVAV